MTTTLVQQQQLTDIVLPTHHPFTVALSLPQSLKRPAILEAVLRPKTLGATTAYAINELQTITAPLIQQSDGLYIANFLTPDVPGIYTVSVHIGDTNGNIVEQPLAEIRVSLPIQVLTSDTKQPLTDARIFLSGYNLRTKHFEPINNIVTAISNPTLTDSNGIYAVALPKGTYKAEVTTLGYKNKTITFILGNGENKIFPVIYLEKTPISFLSFSSYLITNTQDDIVVFWNALMCINSVFSF